MNATGGNKRKILSVFGAQLQNLNLHQQHSKSTKGFLG
jgi:hypothetical protein